MKVELDRITEVGRARREYRNLDQLAASIRELGVLSPIAVTADLQLICGGRRVRAARMAGLTHIPATVVANMDDALLRLKAERDENVCREPMTPEEMYDLGQVIEAMEKPKAVERMAEGGRRGGAARVGSTDPTLRDESQRTNAKVAEGLGTSRATYDRIKRVVETARGERETATPEERAIAQQAVADINDGKISVRAADNQLREFRHPKKKEATPVAATTTEESRLAMPQPPAYGPRRKHRQILDSAVVTADGMRTALDEIKSLDGSVDKEEADRYAADLSQLIRSLKRIHSLLKAV